MYRLNWKTEDKRWQKDAGFWIEEDTGFWKGRLVESD
jgi:hypothetical protein